MTEGPGIPNDADSAGGDGDGGSAGGEEKPDIKEEQSPIYGNSWAIIIGCDVYQKSDIPGLGNFLLPPPFVDNKN